MHTTLRPNEFCRGHVQREIPNVCAYERGSERELDKHRLQLFERLEWKMHLCIVLQSAQEKGAKFRICDLDMTTESGF